MAAPAPQPESPAQPIKLTLSSSTLRTLPGGAGITITAESSGTNPIQWKLADGAPGVLSASTGTSVTYLPPATRVAATTLVPIVATSGGTTSTLTIAITPDPGPSGVSLVAGAMDPDGTGVGSDAQFYYGHRLATDLKDNIFVLEYFTYRPRPGGYGGLRRIAPDGTVTTLVGSADGVETWFGRTTPPDNRNLFVSLVNFAVDTAGDFHIGTLHKLPTKNNLEGSALLKLTSTGTLSILAGSGPSDIVDGTGTAARFRNPDTVGIDYDDVIYVQDENNVARKVTMAGVVTTIPAIPRSLQADMHGNTYAFDAANKTLVRTSPAGEKTVVAGDPSCTYLKPGPLPGCLPNDVRHLIIGGASTLLLLGDRNVVKVVLPH